MCNEWFSRITLNASCQFNLQSVVTLRPVSKWRSVQAVEIGRSASRQRQGCLRGAALYTQKIQARQLHQSQCNLLYRSDILKVNQLKVTTHDALADHFSGGA